MDVRNAVIETLLGVVKKQQSSQVLLPKYFDIVAPKDKALYHSLCLGVLRHYFFLEKVVGLLIDKKPKNKDFDIILIMFLGVYQLRFTDTPDHAAIHETVELCHKRKKKWAKAWVNKCLRNWQKNHLELSLNLPGEARFSLPDWWLKKLQKQWPSQWQGAVEHNQQPPKTSLNVNTRIVEHSLFLQKLQTQDIANHPNNCNNGAVTLDKNVDITTLPGYQEGWFAVQDAGAQFAATLLDIESKHKVLDSCAAPGGKTFALSKLVENTEQVVAIELDKQRFNRLEENMARLQCQAQLINGDATQPDSWWDKQLFDRILLDAPCSAAGIIRRHPDIMLLRQQKDLVQLTHLQQEMLSALWPLLKPGGKLLYVTCSVFAEENQKQIQRFCKGVQDATMLQTPVVWGENTGYGQQLLPAAENDGFFYALLQKQI